MLDVNKLFEVTNEERFMKHHIQSYEILMKLIFPAMSAMNGRHIQSGCSIIDMEGISSFPGKEEFDMSRQTAKIT